MIYFYRFSEVPDHEPYEYYTTEEINSVPIYPATPELMEEWESEDQGSDLWCVHDPSGWSWEPGEYDNIDKAREDLGVSLNMSVYEYINDI